MTNSPSTGHGCGLEQLGQSDSSTVKPTNQNWIIDYSIRGGSDVSGIVVQGDTGTVHDKISLSEGVGRDRGELRAARKDELEGVVTLLQARKVTAFIQGRYGNKGFDLPFVTFA